jgi:hypothetical protein
MKSFVRLALACSVSLAAAVPTAARAQGAADRATFYLLLNNDTLGIERAVRTNQRLEGDFLDKMRGIRVRYALTLAPDATATCA